MTTIVQTGVENRSGHSGLTSDELLDQHGQEFIRRSGFLQVCVTMFFCADPWRPWKGRALKKKPCAPVRTLWDPCAPVRACARLCAPVRTRAPLCGPVGTCAPGVPDGVRAHHNAFPQPWLRSQTTPNHQAWLQSIGKYCGLVAWGGEGLGWCPKVAKGLPTPCPHHGPTMPTPAHMGRQRS